MAGPATVNLRAYRGDTWATTFRLVGSDGNPVDLTEMTVASWAARNGDTPIILPATVDPDPTTGVFTITLPEATLADTYRYDVELTDPEGNVTSPICGRLIVDQDVTNRDQNGGGAPAPKPPALDPTGQTDSTPALQAAYDAGTRKFDLACPNAVYLMDSALFLDSTNKNEQVVFDFGGSTIKLGAGLPTVADFTPDTTVKAWLFPNTKRSALAGGVVSATGNTATTGRGKPHLILENAQVDGTAIPGSGAGLVFGNHSGATLLRQINHMGCRFLLSWAGYTDGNSVQHVWQTGSVLPDSWAMYAITNGDTIVLVSIGGVSGSGAAKLYGNNGVSVEGGVAANYHLTLCQSVRYSASHLEGDQSGVISPMVWIDRCQVTILGVDFFSTKDPTELGNIVICDTPSTTRSSLVSVQDCWFRTFVRTADVDPNVQPDIYIASMNIDSVLEVRNPMSVITSQATSLDPVAGLVVAAADPGLQVVIAAAYGLSGHSFRLEQSAGAFELSPL